MAKEKSGLTKLLPVALSGALMALGAFWLVVGLIISICTSFKAGVIQPVFWIIGGAMLIVGVVIFVVLKLSKKK